MGLLMVCYGGLEGVLAGLTKSTDLPSITISRVEVCQQGALRISGLFWGSLLRRVKAFLVKRHPLRCHRHGDGCA